MKVLGIDSSLTGTGLAFPDEAWTVKTRKRYWDRIIHIQGEVQSALDRGPELVVMEGPAYGSAGSSYHQTAGLWWILGKQIFESGVSVLIAPPSSVKKFATGKGNADKDAMMLATARSFSWFDGDNNAADALWCSLVGVAWAGGQVPGRTKVNMDALAGLIVPGSKNDLYGFRLEGQ